MTLVAGLSIGGLPAFVGDLLLSWRAPFAVDLPTQASKSPQPGLGKDYAAGLAQKLVIVRPYLMIAWAGEVSEVKRLVSQLDAILPQTTDELSGLEPILDVLDSCKEGVELVALVIKSGKLYPFCIRTRGFEFDDRRVYLLGSGASHFFQHLQERPGILPDQEQPDGLMARASLLRFAARAMVAQWKGSTGLSESWGGGFEVAYPDQNGFTKTNDVMFRAWLIDEKGKYFPSGRFFFSRYYGQDLYLSWFSEDEKTYVVPSLAGRAVEAPAYEEVHPSWTLDIFLIRPIASFVEVARFHPPNRPVPDLVRLERGILVGWSMDQEYVDWLAKEAVRAAGTPAFTARRY